MKKILKIEGLDCANCARTLEIEINKIDEVKNAKIDFVKSKLSFESENVDVATRKIIALAHQIEPDARIITAQSGKRQNHTFINVLLLIFGTILGVCALFINMPTVLFWVLYVVGALLIGFRTYFKAIILLFKGTINENLLITIAVVGASAIGEYMEALMVIFLYTIGKILEGIAVNKSRKSIEKITNIQPEYAVTLNDDVEEKVLPESVKIGSVIVVKPGERVPIDGVVLEGMCSIDMQSLTGESLPVGVKPDDEVLSGSIVLDGVLKVRTTKEYGQSTVSKILELIEDASEKKSKTETVISKISKWYTLGVILLAVIVWGIVWAVGKNFDTALYSGLIFLVVSCPCAFAISVPLSYFSGIGNASKNGILIKGSNYLDACAKMNVVAFDKTGTLTTGIFSVEKVVSYDKSKTEEDIIYIASLGEQNSLHPIAKSIINHNKKKLVKVKNFKEIAGEGVYFSFKDSKYFVGRKGKNKNNTTVEVFENEKKIGEIVLCDTIKETSSQACANLKDLGVKTVMLSGDVKEIAESVGKQVGVEEIHAELLPQDKYSWIETAKKDEKTFVGYVGDGINDAPSLMLADVGISMGINGSASSVEASDIVLVDDNPKKVATAIKISKYTRKIVWENIIVSAIVKVLFLILAETGVSDMASAVFADVGVTVLAVLNSLRALYFSPNKTEHKRKK